MDKYLVYENWRAENKAVVHKSDCGHAKDGNERLQDLTAPNDRWFGHFNSLESAIVFASLLPRREMKLCKTCLSKMIVFGNSNLRNTVISEEQAEELLRDLRNKKIGEILSDNNQKESRKEKINRILDK
ncbi:hypothetical protein [Flavobacterium sp. ASV13]|uniref:hypothetical protein n=1 Tax=Flavobacterium sp. ASV13 TaxID=1506583 RepID=UPI000558BCB5|nr:hypothetical protein [Flavobacterium sp. ASV13]